MTARPRHVPKRTCVACRQEQPKRGLVRVVRGPDGRVAVDLTGKAPGRGAYLCHDPQCWTSVLRRNALAGALKTTLLAEDREALERFRDSLVPSAATANP